MKIYTKTGDKGETSLFGGGRVLKNNIRVEAYGTVDELNSALGMIKAWGVSSVTEEAVKKIQNQLFILGGELASNLKRGKELKIPQIEPEDIKFLEEQIDFLESKIPALKNFVLPGGSKGASLLHFARTICRRAERRCVELNQKERINENILIYLNRLSDLLFVLARYENQSSNTPEEKWVK